jgi:hypothetical protein
LLLHASAVDHSVHGEPRWVKISASASQQSCRNPVVPAGDDPVLQKARQPAEFAVDGVLQLGALRPDPADHR